MLDLSKAVLPHTITVCGKLYPVRTNFKYWLIFARKIQERTTPIGDFDYIYDGAPPPARVTALQELIRFYNPHKELPRKTGDEHAGEKVIDYDLDADLIYAAFRQCYGVDLVTADMHWHVFLALLDGITGTKLNDIIQIRTYTHTGKPDEYSRAMERLKKAWSLPALPDEALTAFDALLK